MSEHTPPHSSTIIDDWSIDRERDDARPDAGHEPVGAEPVDAEAVDAEPVDAEAVDAEPVDAEPVDDGVERGELIAPETTEDEEPPHNSITEPAKVMRIGSMVKQLLEEVRHAPLDDASRERLAEVYDRSIVELSEALSPDLQEELRMLTLPFDHEGIPSDAELRVAKAQLVGWLEGLFHGIQASLVAQQMAARHQLEQMRQLNVAPDGSEQPNRPSHLPPQVDRPGTYI